MMGNSFYTESLKQLKKELIWLKQGHRAPPHPIVASPTLGTNPGLRCAFLGSGEYVNYVSE